VQRTSRAPATHVSKGNPFTVTSIDFHVKALVKRKVPARQLGELIHDIKHNPIFQPPGEPEEKLPSTLTLTRPLQIYSRAALRYFAARIEISDSLWESVDGTTMTFRDWHAVVVGGTEKDEPWCGRLQVSPLKYKRGSDLARLLKDTLDHCLQYQNLAEVYYFNWVVVDCTGANTGDKNGLKTQWQKILDSKTEEKGVDKVTVHLKRCSDHIMNLVCKHTRKRLVDTFGSEFFRTVDNVHAWITSQFNFLLWCLQESGEEKQREWKLTSENRFLTVLLSVMEVRSPIPYLLNKHSIPSEKRQSVEILRDEKSQHLMTAIEFILIKIMKFLREVKNPMTAEEYTKKLKSLFHAGDSLDSVPEQAITAKEWPMKNDRTTRYNIKCVRIFSQVIKTMLKKHDSHFLYERYSHSNQVIMRYTKMTERTLGNVGSELPRNARTNQLFITGKVRVASFFEDYPHFSLMEHYDEQSISKLRK
jgi:hypothetical protein